MSQSEWVLFQSQIYEIKNFLSENEINTIIQNLKKCNVNQTQFDLCFKNEKSLEQFLKIKEQQIKEQQYYNITETEQSEQSNKFRRRKDLQSADYEVRQLLFNSCQFLNIFMKIYQLKIKQIESDYNYKLQQKFRFLRVYFPKNQKISSFFKNQIFEMKTKLNIYYSYNQNVINKIKYSVYFNKFIQKKDIAAQIFKRPAGNTGFYEGAVFYSNVHQKKEIINIVTQNLLEHTSILNFIIPKLSTFLNQILFKLMMSFLVQHIKMVEKQEEIIVQTNYSICCILVHDRNECFTDAKQKIMSEMGKLLFFRLTGIETRSIFNKVAKNHKRYPFLRVKYSQRSIFCSFNYSIFYSNKENPNNANDFCQLFKEYFETLNQQNKITYYLQSQKSYEFAVSALELIQYSNITIDNFQDFMVDEKIYFTKIILGVKSLIGLESVIQTRNLFYETFLKLILKKQFLNDISTHLNISAESFSNILGFSNKPSTILRYQNSLALSQDEFKKELETLTKPSQNYQSILLQNSKEKNFRKKQESRHQRQKQKRQKFIQIQYPYKPIQFDSDLNQFWEKTTRERKLQRMIVEQIPDPFSKCKIKISMISSKIKIDPLPAEQIQPGKVYLSTKIQRSNQIFYHFIDLDEFKKLQSESKIASIFLFYKHKQKELFSPSYVLELLT